MNCFQICFKFAFKFNLRRYNKENQGAFLASEKATPTSSEYQVAIAGNGECSMTSATGLLAVSRAKLVSFLRFEEGPCDKVGRCRLTR